MLFRSYNETAEKRVVGISVETRPDWVSEQEIRLWRELGVTKVQLGVQAFDEEILKKIKGGIALTKWPRQPECVAMRV